MLDIVNFYVEHKRLPAGKEVKELAEQYKVHTSTIMDDIRKIKKENLQDKFSDALDKIIDGFINDKIEMKHADVIKGYQATRPKQVETKIDGKLELNIRGNAIGDALKELKGILDREDIHEETTSSS